MHKICPSSRLSWSVGRLVGWLASLHCCQSGKNSCVSLVRPGRLGTCHCLLVWTFTSTLFIDLKYLKYCIRVSQPQDSIWNVGIFLLGNDFFHFRRRCQKKQNLEEHIPRRSSLKKMLHSKGIASKGKKVTVLKMQESVQVNIWTWRKKSRLLLSGDGIAWSQLSKLWTFL